MSALFLEDIAKKFKPEISDLWALRVSKLTSCLGGLFVTGFAFVVPKFDKYVIKLAIQFFGIIGGPYFTLFALGIFTDRTNTIGAYVSALISFSIGMVLSIGQIYYPPDLSLPSVSLDGCSALNVTVSEHICSSTHVSSDKIAMFFSISYCWHGMISMLLACAIGYTVSLCSSENDGIYLKKNLLYDYKNNFFL